MSRGKNKIENNPTDPLCTPSHTNISLYSEGLVFFRVFIFFPRCCCCNSYIRYCICCRQYIKQYVQRTLICIHIFSDSPSCIHIYCYLSKRKKPHSFSQSSSGRAVLRLSEFASRTRFFGFPIYRRLVQSQRVCRPLFVVVNLCTTYTYILYLHITQHAVRNKTVPSIRRAPRTVRPSRARLTRSAYTAAHYIPFLLFFVSPPHIVFINIDEYKQLYIGNRTWPRSTIFCRVSANCVQRVKIPKFEGGARAQDKRVSTLRSSSVALAPVYNK